MRSEWKHQYFKKLPGVVCNFKNICFTFAKRDQLRLCWELTSLDWLKQKAESKGDRSIPICAINNLTTNAMLHWCGLSEDDIDTMETAWKVNELSVDHNTYKTNDICSIDLLQWKKIFFFLKIVHIVQFRNCWLCEKQFSLLQYVSHRHGYEVKQSG